MFIARVKSNGFTKVLNEAIEAARIFRGTGHEKTVLRCLETVAHADGTLHQRERDLIDKIRESLNC